MSDEINHWPKLRIDWIKAIEAPARAQEETVHGIRIIRHEIEDKPVETGEE